MLSAPAAAADPASAKDAAKGTVDGFDKRVRPLLDAHCSGCHGTGFAEGGVDFDTMTSRSAILNAGDVWRRAREALETQHMPPEPADTGFTPEERQRLARWIREEIETVDVDADEFRHPGPSFIRQLTPYEYMRTMRDLLYLTEIPFGRLGVKQDYPQEGLEYVNQALGQTLSTADFDRALRTGEEALKQLFGDESGIWRKLGGGARRDLGRAGEAARPKVLFVEPAEEGEEGPTEEEAARQILERFATRAFRRPVTEDELATFMGLFQRSRELEGSYEESLQVAMSAVLASPHFLLRVEKNQRPAGSDERYPVTAHELATRLSYFLWSSMPDDQLLEQANSGALLDEEVLAAEVDRMLADERAGALTEHFARQWLQLRLMELPSLPSRRGFPKMTDDVREAFRQEMLTFFDRLRTEDESVLDLLDSDYAYVNRTLADFYGLELSDGAKRDSKRGGNRRGGGGRDEFVRVPLEPEDHRGGLLGMGGFLWMTSHENRTKPTARGTWILEVVLGTPPPPPPPEAGSFSPPDEDLPPPKNFREQLQRHASDASCVGCHRKIDPLGFALENFDPVGQWRETVNGDPVDNAGELPDGQSFRGFEQLREVVTAREDQFLRNFAGQLLRYALGRELLYTDRGTVERIARRVEANDGRFSELIKGIVLSRAFRERANLESVVEVADAEPSAAASADAE